jgi:hypothetical protein
MKGQGNADSGELFALSVQLNAGAESRRKSTMSVQKKTVLGQKKTKDAKAAKGKLDAKTIKSASKEINLKRVGGDKPIGYM